jgi:hypothetical protein
MAVRDEGIISVGGFPYNLGRTVHTYSGIASSIIGALEVVGLPTLIELRRRQQRRKPETGGYKGQTENR